METKKYFNYLEQLRNSGVTNMFGAIPYLQETFPELRNDWRKAHVILQEWMASFHNVQEHISNDKKEGI